MKLHKGWLAVFAVLVFWGAGIAPARADLHLNVNRGTVNPLPIAIPDFSGSVSSDPTLGHDLVTVISNDLDGSGLFKTLDPKSFIQQAKDAATNPDFKSWGTVGAQALVTGTISTTGGDRTRVEFRLWDVESQQQLVGMAYMTTPTNWRRIGHIIADSIYERITGEKGYFDSRIVYIAQTGPYGERTRRLAIMDQDGANVHYLTNGDAIVLTPRFSPTQQQITYMAYYNHKPRVYLYNISTGAQQVLGDFPNMTFAPRFSPDGSKVIMSLSDNDGNSDIYTMGTDSHNVVRLTHTDSINTSPTYSPDGKYIAFESDRSGSQQIYVMNADGSGAHRITFGSGRYASPVWSPRGDLIAFTRIYKNEFYIGVIHPDGTGERLITHGFDVEAPTWSPNGRVLCFFKVVPTGPHGEGRSSRLYTIDLTGFNEHMIKSPTDASDPAWSPLNK